MLNNLIRIALRNFVKDKGYSLLNILGLTIGITFSLLLLFYVLDELSYDKHHANANRLYRIASYIQEPENASQWALTQLPLGPALKKDFPEVEMVARFVPGEQMMFGTADRQFYEDKIFFCDSTVFRMFTHPFLAGDPHTALDMPNSMVLTEAMATKYFGGVDQAMGQGLRSDEGKVYKITGVSKDPPKNSHILFNGLISISSLPKYEDEGWGSFGNYTYVLLNENADPQRFEARLLPLYEKYMAKIFAQFHIKIHYGLQLITDIHLRSKLSIEPEELGSMSYIYIFLSVAFFMLLIASINYMNLTTARSARRAKEIGIRKVTGSTRSQLITQFITESFVMTFISILLSIGSLYFLLPAFNSLAGKQLEYSYVFQPASLLVLIAILLFVGLVGGSYPAFYLAKFNPVTVLKGNLSKSSSNVVLRRILVTVQFSISMVMIICTWIVYSQLQYMRKKDLGFDREHVLALNVRGQQNQARIQTFMDELKSNPHVKGVSSSNAVPGRDGMGFNLLTIESENGFTDKGVNNFSVNREFLGTMGIQLVRGRNFISLSDTARSVLVNENMVRSFGWKEPLGKKIKHAGDTSGKYFEVVGVVKDFHQKSLYEPIAPLVLFCTKYDNCIQVRLNPSDVSLSLETIGITWKKYFQGLSFDYAFLDQDYNSQYSADRKRAKVFTTFSILTVFITCLGLIGLIAFTTTQRQKEISIRKVMGAGLPQIVTLIAGNFVVLVLISCLLSFPIAYYFMHKWLEAFPYKAGMDGWVFVFSAMAVLCITLLTISFHTIKVALSNPVKSLRTE